MSKSLVDEPRYLRADLDDHMLRVSRSPVVRDGDSLFAPVAEILRRYRNSIVLDYTEPSPAMVSGMRRVTIYQLAMRSA